MASSDSQRQRIQNQIAELRLEIAALKEVNKDLRTELSQARKKLKNYEGLSKYLFRMRRHLSELTEALLNSTKKVNNLKGQISAILSSATQQREPNREVKDTVNEPIYQTVQIKKEKTERVRNKLVSMADLPPLVEHEDE